MKKNSITCSYVLKGFRPDGVITHTSSWNDVMAPAEHICTHTHTQNNVRRTICTCSFSLHLSLSWCLMSAKIKWCLQVSLWHFWVGFHLSINNFSRLGTLHNEERWAVDPIKQIHLRLQRNYWLLLKPFFFCLWTCDICSFHCFFCFINL